MGYYTDKKGNDWYLIKDSSSGSRNNDVKAPEFGYYFFSADSFLNDYFLDRAIVVDFFNGWIDYISGQGNGQRLSNVNASKFGAN